ncbi:HCL676Wp [Eremothecium sinecaudum]|uniref:HCL676Wp n=1 Tax=Eremothecium sinecaudum TaxID=45286 RepID=A0A109UXT4_9SACH|nr:HCL676Wp [Eremothecium sinecaudum]AMD19475.1 HCL676Wp [Eremothecium sinecaudum]
MALSRKRMRSTTLQGPASLKKRQCVLSDISSVALPRSTLLLTKTNKLRNTKKQGSSDSRSYSSSEDLDSNCVRVREVENQFNPEYYGGCKGSIYARTPKLEPKLLETVSRYSDSGSLNIEKDKEQFAAHASPLDSNYSFNFKRSIPRHSSFSISGTRQRQVPRSDVIARSRCFDYILQSIDEVWGRYCNTTCTAENEVYERLGNSINGSVTISGSPNSSFFQAAGNHNGIEHRERELSDYDLSDSGYKSEITNPTEYETDCDYRKVSKLPQSMQLQSLKNRLVRAKNDLENSYDTTDWNDCVYFWRRWDMIKYSAVEMMEEDDDDDLIESVIDELEEGRCYNDA